MTLSAVPDVPDDPEYRQPRVSIPAFEGHPVARTQMVLSGTNKLECDDRVLEVDDIVRITIEARVSGVHFDVDERDGTLVRIQKAKALDIEFTPWDPENPADHGVIDQ